MINYISKYGIILNFYNYYGYYTGSFYPRKKNVSGFLNVAQAAFYLDYGERLYIAKSFIYSATHHILRNMRYYKVEQELIDLILMESYNLESAEDIQTVMGIEGRIRKTYYRSFNQILKNGYIFNKREKRPPKDPVNALISFGNSIMYTNVSLDIAEIFKPLIIDPIIFSLINNKRLTKKDFMYEDEICYLSEEGKKKFLSEFENKMTTTIKHRKLNRKVSYRYFIRLECYKLIKHFIGDEKYKVLKAWW